MVSGNFIVNRKIEAFTKNDIDSYRMNIDSKLKDVVKIFLEAKGFVLFVDNKRKFIGYLDISDLEEIHKISTKENLSKSMKELVDKHLINLREEKVKSDDEIKKVLDILDRNNQLYLPVYDNKDNLLGRISVKIIKERAEELYPN